MKLSTPPSAVRRRVLFALLLGVSSIGGCGGVPEGVVQGFIRLDSPDGKKLATDYKQDAVYELATVGFMEECDRNDWWREHFDISYTLNKPNDMGPESVAAYEAMRTDGRLPERWPQIRGFLPVGTRVKLIAIASEYDGVSGGVAYPVGEVLDPPFQGARVNLGAFTTAPAFSTLMRDAQFIRESE